MKATVTQRGLGKIKVLHMEIAASHFGHESSSGDNDDGNWISHAIPSMENLEW